MFKIGDFSRITHVPTSTLRYYADLGLLLPAHIDKFTGYRYYTLDQLPRLNRILALRDLGLPLETIAQVMNRPVSHAELQGMLRLREAELETTLRETEAQLARVRARLHMIEHEADAPRIEAVVKAVPAQTVLATRATIPTGEYVATLMIEMHTVAMRNGVEFAGAPMTIFHDPEFYEANLDVEIALPVDLPDGTAFALGNGREMAVRDLPPIPIAASTLHAGSYDDFLETYAALAAWIADNGLQIAGQPREIYLRPPDDALTEIIYPVDKL